MKNYNVIYIHSHDTGRYIQPYGHQVNTPRLTEFAKEGVMFRKAFAANPTCSPSRAALLTGQYAHVNGMTGLAHRGFSLNNYDDHLVNRLKKKGFHTALAGVQHVAHHHEDECHAALEIIGYDEYLGDRDEAHTKAVEFLDRKQKDKPFFLSIGFFETHRPFPVDHPNNNPDYILPPSPLPDSPEIREDMARFKEMAGIWDKKTGIVLDAIKRNGLENNTLVIITTDHGIAFPRMKCNLYDDGIGVLLMMRGPDGFSGGKVFDEMVSHVDILPTIFDFLDLDIDEKVNGYSFLPLVQSSPDQRQRGGPGFGREEVFSELNFHAKEEPKRCVRLERYKYIKNFDRKITLLENCDNGLSKDIWLNGGVGKQIAAEEELYDLLLDPNERNNIIDSISTDIIEDLRNRLNRWMVETDDPLLGGTIIAPKGAIIDPLDNL